MEGREGKKYKHNNGVFKIRYQGLYFCDASQIVSEGLLVYNKAKTDRAKAEVELARLVLETQEFPESSVTEGKVNTHSHKQNGHYYSLNELVE